MSRIKSFKISQNLKLLLESIAVMFIRLYMLVHLRMLRAMYSILDGVEGMENHLVLSCFMGRS